MERAHVFEATLFILLIGLVSLLYLAIISPTAPAVNGWEIAGDSVDYLLVGGNDTLYVFSGNNITAMMLITGTATLSEAGSGSA